MKNCHKWMIACVVGALAITFVLPILGVPLFGASLLFPLLMIACCVLPMLFMMKADGGNGKEGSCCSKEHKGEQKTKAGAEKDKTGSKSCH